MRKRYLPELRDPLLQRIRQQYEAHYEQTFGRRAGKGLYRNHDWQRLEFALSLIPDDCRTVLDVGVGPGPFLNYLTLSGRFDTVTGIDKAQYSRFLQLTPELDYRIMSITETSFPDRSFDVVFCMEVLEHLDTASLAAALPELRRITKRRLVMSVPFDEPKPLPRYHLQHFDEQRLRAMFPDAEMVLLYRSRIRWTWPWAFVIEEFGG